MFGEPRPRAVEPFDQPDERDIQRLSGFLVRERREHHQQERLAQFQRQRADSVDDRLSAARGGALDPMTVALVERELADMAAVELDEAGEGLPAAGEARDEAVGHRGDAGLPHEFVDETRGGGVIQYITVVPGQGEPETS